jgi:hypothetical protein
MRTINQKSTAEVRVHTYDVQGVPAVPESAHWRLVTDRTGKVIADWTQVDVNPINSGGSLVDCYADVELTGNHTAIPGDYRLLVTFDKDTDTELTEEILFRVKQVKGRG